MKKHLSLRSSQVEEIIQLLRTPNLRQGRELADRLEERLQEGGETYVCEGCGETFPQHRGRPRRTCSERCRQLAFRRRRGAKVREVHKESWREEEVQQLIEIMQSYIGNQHWVKGQRLYAWQSAAQELNRTVKSVQSKWNELKRKGIVKED